MSYSNNCECVAPAAPKLVKTHSVAPAAATEEIVCPDARCLPHLLNSLPETDDAVPNYVGVYKGQSYIAPIRALVDSVLMDSLNSMYRDGKVPTVVNYRDIESVPVIQKENCQKLAVTSMPTLAKAMTTALPAAPAGYEPVKVMTTDKDGDVYLATPVQVVSPGLIPAIIDNCEKNKFANIPALGQIFGFGNSCKDFGMTTIAQLQEALSKVVPLALVKTLPDQLRGWKEGKEFRYPVKLSAVQSVFQEGGVSGSSPTTLGNFDEVRFGRVTGPTLAPGLWIVSIQFDGGVGAATTVITASNFGMQTPIGYSAPSYVMFPGNTSGQPSNQHTYGLVKTVRVGNPLTLYADMIVRPGGQTTIVSTKGNVTFTAQQISETNIVINEVA